MPNVYDLLPRALALAVALPEPDPRRRALLRLSLVASDLGEAELAGEAALALDAPWAQVQERARRLERHLRAPSRDLGAIGTVAAALSGALWALHGSAWRPAALTHPDEARVALVEAWSLLGENDRCDVVLGDMTASGLRALAWASASAGAWQSAPERASAMAHHALTLAMALGDPPALRRVLSVVVVGALAAGRSGAAITAAQELRGLGLDGLAWAHAALVVAERCAEAGELSAAGAMFQRAALSVDEVAGDDLAATTLLLRVAEGQRRHLGPALARTTVGRLLDRLRGQLLGPEPNHRLPYRPLLLASLRDAALAGPLRDLLRAQSVVAPGWCYALGRLELATGHPERARQAARVLEESADIGANDVEARWMAGLLRAEVGDARRARRLLLAALAELPEPAVVDVPGALPDGGRAERVFVEALLRAGDAEGALLLARLTVSAAERAPLLCRCASEAMVRRGPEAAAAPLAEARAALRELPAAGRDPALAFEVAATCADLGEDDAAVVIFEAEWAVARARPASVSATALLADDWLAHRPGAALSAALAAARSDALALAEDDAARLSLMLGLLERRHRRVGSPAAG